MKPNHNKSVEILDKVLKKYTKKDLEKYFSSVDKPKGWLSIEEYLPEMMVSDVEKGHSIYMVRDVNGNEFETKVSDHNVWYYEAKRNGITHWLNK